jgi:hypothetical protein
MGQPPCQLEWYDLNANLGSTLDAISHCLAQRCAKTSGGLKRAWVLSKMSLRVRLPIRLPNGVGELKAMKPYTIWKVHIQIESFSLKQKGRPCVIKLVQD